MKPFNRHAFTIIIGIDPGTNTGICIWDKKKREIIYLETLKIHKGLELVRQWALYEREKILVRVEDPRLATYGRQNDVNKAQGAGSVKRDASIWEDFLADLKVEFEMLRPNKKITKLDDPMFRKVTGYKYRTSNHGRDAAMLVYGF